MMPLHYNRTPVVDGTASVHHGLAFMMGRFMYSRTVMGRAALVHHRLRLVMLCAPVHAGTLLFGNVLMNRRAVMGRTALVHHRLRFVMLCTPVHAGTLMSGIASMHSRSCLMAGTAFMYRPDLLCLRGTLSAGMTGRRCFGNSHQERGAEETCHQSDCQYSL